MLTAKDVGFEIDGNQIFSGVDFSISVGDKAGLIGPNGAGKTTLLRMLAGDIEPTDGKILREDVEVGLLPQDLRDWLDHSVYDFLQTVTGIKAVKDAYDKVENQYKANPDQQTLALFCDAADRLSHYQVDTFEGRAVRALKDAGLSEDFSSREIGALSGGQKTRVALAAIMAAPYDVILLDEPTNNLDLQGIVILEKFIQRSRAAFLMVSHDRRFLRNATTRIIELLGGDKGVNQYGLGYDEYLEARALAYEADRRRYAEHQQSVKDLQARVRDRKIQANSAEHGGAKRSDNDKATANYRAARAAGHLSGQARSLETRLEQLKDNAPQQPQPPISLDFMFPETDSAGGDVLLTVQDLVVTYDNQNGQSFGPYNLFIKRGQRIAITGANGIGKSTLLRAIAGELNIAEGSSHLAPSARVAYIDQMQSLPSPEKTALHNLQSLSPGLSREDAIHLLVKFNMRTDQISVTPVSKMSGGERAKILLASVAARKANLLILDEPTNNLDLPTIEGLQEALSSYKGAIIVVSHDRDFLDGIKADELPGLFLQHQ